MAAAASPAENPQPKHSHGASLCERSHRAIPQCHPDDEKADCVISSVAKKIERVCLKRCGPHRKTCSDLNGKHHRIDSKDAP
jgi:hypothetical protein